MISFQRWRVPSDVLFVGKKDAGKSSLLNMVLGVPDNSPRAAQVTDRSTSQITSYATLFGPFLLQIWDTPGFDNAQDGHYVKGKINDWLLHVSPSYCKDDLEADHPYLNTPIARVVWCMHAGELSDLDAWQQFRAIYEECHGRSRVISMILINQVSTQSPSDWEVQCENQLERLGLSAGSIHLKSVRSHRGVSSPEYEDGCHALSQLILPHGVDTFQPNIVRTNCISFRVPPLTWYPKAKAQINCFSFRCEWVTIHPESICNGTVLFFGIADLHKHLRLCHGSQVYGPRGKVVACHWGDCNQNMQSENIPRHIRERHLRYRAICPICSRAFSRADVLYAHMRRQHGI